MRPVRIAAISDIFLDRAPVKLGPVNADLILIAGNIAKADPVGAVRWATENFKSVPTVIVPGRSDVMAFTHPEALGYMRETSQGSLVSVLDDEVAQFEINSQSVRVLGSTLWSRKPGWLERKLSQPYTGATIVLTNDAPNPDDWRDVLKIASVNAWVHGHAQLEMPSAIGDTQLFSNPRCIEMGDTIQPLYVSIS